MDTLEAETEAAQKEKAELEALIGKAEAKVKRKRKTESKAALQGEMEPWVEGIFIYRDQEGGILAFSYGKDRYAIKDGEMAEVPEYIANHINSLTSEEPEWVRDGRDDFEGKQGTMQVKTRKRCEFKVTRRFERPKGYKIKQPARHLL